MMSVMAQIQFSLIQKIRIGRPEHSLPSTHLHPITSYFCLTTPPPPPPPIPPKSGRHMCITPYARNGNFMSQSKTDIEKLG